jgi:hypothetical protein
MDNSKHNKNLQYLVALGAASNLNKSGSVCLFPKDFTPISLLVEPRLKIDYSTEDKIVRSEPIVDVSFIQYMPAIEDYVKVVKSYWSLS